MNKEENFGKRCLPSQNTLSYNIYILQGGKKNKENGMGCMITRMQNKGKKQTLLEAIYGDLCDVEYR